MKDVDLRTKPKRWYAKRAGKSGWAVFEKGLDLPIRSGLSETDATEIATLANELEEALDDARGSS